MEQIKASVIIPSYNMRQVIGDCLDSVLAQKTEFPFEVIVADSSNDGTADWLEKKYPEIKLIRLKERTYPGAARNAAIQIAAGDILAFTDCDCIVDPRWLQYMIESQQAGRRVVGGPVGNGTPFHPVGTAEFLLEFNSFLGNSLRQVKLLPTCNISYGRELFDQYGLFLATIKGSDSVFGRKISSAGIRVFLDPNIRMIHRNRTSLRKFFRNQYQLGIGSAQTRKILKISGRLLLKYPVLAVFIPFLRTVAISCRLLRWSPLSWIGFVLLYWLIFPGLVVFTAGFLHGSRQPLPNNLEKQA